MSLSRRALFARSSGSSAYESRALESSAYESRAFGSRTEPR